MTRYERIVAARNAGASWAAIADTFGITEAGARGVYSRYRSPERTAHARAVAKGLAAPLSRQPRLDWARIVDLYSRGWSLREVAAEVGCTPPGARSVLVRKGIDRRPQGVGGGGRPRKINRAKAVTLRAQGLTYREIGVQFGVTGAAVWNALRAANHVR